MPVAGICGGSRRPFRAPRSGTSASPGVGSAGCSGDAVVLHHQGTPAPIWDVGSTQFPEGPEVPKRPKAMFTETGGHFAANEHLSGSRAACRARRCLCGIPVTRQVGALGGPSHDFILHGRGQRGEVVAVSTDAYQ
jgi:hypothetical protein